MDAMVLVPTPPLSPLVMDLKREHAEIIQSMAEVKRMMVAANGGTDTLSAARDLLLAHLKKEDDQLYGVLFLRAQSDAALAKTLDLFARDMQEISTFAIHFFTTHSAGCKAPDFARDFSKLIGVLGNRILREEIILYPAYDLAVTK
jgi:hypothetical protein